MNYSWNIGWRYLRSKKRSTVSVITIVAIAGVALGVASLLCVLSITSGFQEAFRSKVLGVNAHVLVLKYGLDFAEYPEVLKKVSALKEVEGAAPFFIQEMMMAKERRLSGVLVKGVDPQALVKVLDLPDQIVSGSLQNLRLKGSAPPRAEDVAAEPAPLDSLLRNLDDNIPDTPKAVVEDDRIEVPKPEQAEAALTDGELVLPSDQDEEALVAQDTLLPEKSTNAKLPGVVVGKTLAQSLNVKVGDHVALISPLAGLDAATWSPGSGKPASRTFRVQAIFEAGFQEYDSRLVYVDLYELQSFFEHGDTVTGVELRLKDLDRARSVARRIERMLGDGPYHTLDWSELNHNLFTALEIQKIILSMLIATIMFVAAFNVVATLIMMVLEKRKEIAILKAMGATDQSVLAIFMIQGTTIGILGTAAGLILGGALSWYLNTFRLPLDPKVYLIDHLPIKTSLFEFTLTTGVALFISITATVLPSLWAARLIPAEALRPR